MSKSKGKSFTSIIFESLGWPLFWGLSATFAFYLLIGWGIIQSPIVSRYFAGHPVEYVETALFFIGAAALLMKAADLAFQFKVVPSIALAAPQESGDELARAKDLLESVGDYRSRIRNTYLAKRLANILRYIKRSESIDELDEQMRYLADVDAERSHEGYSLVRMIVWATPMLGFLGTVIGITLALGDLSPEALVNAPKEAMQGLLGGLSIAFDTTALALSLSIILMFAQFVVREVESQLLMVVDRKVEDEMIGRFQQSGGSHDPAIGVVEKMSTRLMCTVEELVQHQTDALESTLSRSQQHWSETLQITGSSVQTSFEAALQKTMMAHAETVSDAEELADQRATERWENIHQGMQQQASVLAAQYAEIGRQGEVMHRLLEATNEIGRLESALNQNLTALAGSKNFEDTVLSLSAAIQLLSSRLGTASPKDYRFLDESKGHAA